MNCSRNFVFSLVLVFVMLGPIALWVVQDRLHVELAPCLTSENARYLEGGYEQPFVKQNLSVAGFRDELFQESVEKAINNHAPFRASCILGCTLFQNAAISLSNLFFEWDCYPTYYDSEIVYIPASNSLRTNPNVFSDTPISQALSGIDEFGRGVSKYASQHPDLEICIAVPSVGYKISVTPVWNYVSRKWSIDDCISIWSPQMENISNLSIAYDELDDYEEYLKYYYSTDDHWNGFGAIRAYDIVAKKIGLPVFGDAPRAIGDLKDFIFYGQLGRQGRMLVDNRGSLVEPLLDTSNFEVSESIATAPVMNQQILLEGEPLYADYNFYVWYYGDDKHSMISNRISENSENVLLVCDSYGEAFRWVVASQCSKVYSAFTMCRLSRDQNATLDELVQSQDITKIIFVGNIVNYSTFVERYPRYF